MNEPTSFASLGPTLLARKGTAKPAMRSQHWNSGAANAAQAAEALEDLGWNDMGEEDQEVEHSATVLSLTPARPSRADDPDDEDETADSGPLIAGNDIDEVHSVEQIDDSAEDDCAEDDNTSEFVSQDLDDDEDYADYEEEYDEAADAELAKWVAHKPEVRRQQEELAEVLGAEEEAYEQPKKKRASRRGRESALDKGGRAAFTLRLDAERHLKLRLACTIRNRSAQQLVTEALDDFLGRIQEVETLAAQLKKSM